MSSIISVQIKNSQITIRGDLRNLEKKTAHWLKTRVGFKQINDEVFIIENQKYLNDSSLFAFKNSLTRNGNNDIKFDEKFNTKIQRHVSNESKFQDFSAQAKRIWEGSYDIIEFEKFTKILNTNLERKLYRLQLLSAYHMAFSQHSCNFSVPGSGKTSIVYGAYSYLNSLEINHDKYVNKIIVVGPPSSFTPWIEEYKDCFGKEVNYFILDGRNSQKSKADVLRGTSGTQPDLLLTTYQSFPSLVNYVIHYMNIEQNNVMLVCDEAHKFKGHEGVWSSSILQSAEFACSRIVLTGTPVPNGYEDLYNLFKFIYPNKNVINTRRDYLVSLTRNYDSRAINEMIESIKPYFVRINKSDLNLPAITKDENIPVNMSKLESQIYLKINSAFEDRNFDSDIAKTTIWHRIRQAASNLKLLNKNILLEDIFENKIDNNLNIEKILGPKLYSDLLEIESDYIPSKHIQVCDIIKKLKGQKVVIWGYYIDSIKSLDKYLKSQGLKGEVIIGETKKETNISNYEEDYKTREKIINNFKTDIAFNYIITNPIVLGESVSLHKVCHNSIYFELDYSAAPYIQSRDRIHRVWLINNIQKNYKTNYYHLLSVCNNSNTVDTHILNNIKVKFERMKDVIEHDIPLFSENLEEDRDKIIQKLIFDYRKTHNQ